LLTLIRKWLRIAVKKDKLGTEASTILHCWGYGNLIIITSIDAKATAALQKRHKHF